MRWMALVLTCLVALLLALSPLTLSGCGTTPEQRLQMGQAWLSTGQTWSKDFGDAIAACQLILDDVQVKLRDPNLPPAETAKLKAIFTQTTAQMQAFVAKKALIDQDLALLQARLQEAQAKGATLQNEMEFYGQGLQVLGQRTGGSAGGILGLAGVLVGALGGGLAGFAKNQKLQGVLANVVTSVGALLASPTVSNRDLATATLEAGQLPTTQAEVRKLLGKAPKA